MIVEAIAVSLAVGWAVDRTILARKLAAGKATFAKSMQSTLNSIRTNIHPYQVIAELKKAINTP